LGCRVLAEALRRRGYDVDESAARLGAGGSLAARRERSDRADLVVVDAGGRFRGEVTAVVGDRSRTTTVGGLEVRLVETEQVVSVVTALLPDADALAPLLDALDRAIGTADRPVARSSADRIPASPPGGQRDPGASSAAGGALPATTTTVRFPGRGAETNGRRRTPTTPSRGGASCAGRRR
jgi:hypothetical protein